MVKFPPERELDMGIGCASRIMKTLHLPRPMVDFALRQFVRCEMIQAIKEERQQDAKNNVLFSPPEEERIAVHCVWATEFYGPADRKRLGQSLRRLDRQETGNLPADQGLHDWLSKLDRYQSGVAYRSLGLMKPRGVVFPHGVRNYVVDMPEHVAFAEGTIAYVSPALIAIVVCFVLDDQYSSSFDEALRRGRRTLGTLQGLGWETHGPADQKRTAIDEMRKGMIERATSWFRKHIPGIFSSVLEDRLVPTCEFMTVKNAYPFVRDSASTGTPPLYLDLSDDSNRAFAIPRHQQDELRSHSVLADRFDISPTTNEAFVSHALHGAVWPILIAVGTTSLLEAYTEQLNRLRNEESSRLRGLRSVKRTLDRVGKALGYFPTVGVIADGLLNATQQPFSTIGLVQNLCPCSDHDWRKPLRQQLIDTIGVQATWTIQTEVSLRGCVTMGSGRVEALEHQVDHGDVHPRFAALRALLVVFAQPSTSAQPSQGAFHHPPSGQDLEVVAVRFALDHGQQPTAGVPGP